MNAPVAVSETLTLTSVAEFKFRFKRDKNGFQRTPVTLQAPVPTAEGIRKILESGDAKQFELLRDCMYEQVRAVLADKVGGDLEYSQEKLTAEIDSVSWAAIANMPKEDRRSSTIPEEVWTGFVADYVAVMPAITGKTKQQIENATQVFIRKFGPWKSDKDTIKKLLDQLALYVETPRAEEFSDVIELLVRRGTTYLAADDLATISANL